MTPTRQLAPPPPSRHAPATDDVPFSPAAASAVRSLAERPVHVLVVDAEQDGRQSTREVLIQAARAAEAPGLNVTCVATLPEALAMLGGARPLRPLPDVVLLSLELPAAPGLAAFAAARVHGADIPIVVLAEPANEGLAIRALREGAADYLLRGQLHTTLISRSLRHAAERQVTRLALLESQRALTRLLGNLPGIAYRFRTDRRATVEFVSHGVAQILDYTPNDFAALPHRPPPVWFPRIIHPDDRPGVLEIVRAALAAGEPYELECRVVCADGAVRWLWGRGRGMANERGQITAIEGFLADVTARKCAEAAAEESARALAQKEIQLRQAQKLEGIGRLAGGIAHDFNNLLMVILSNAEFAREGLDGIPLPPGASPVEELEEIVGASRRAASLTRQLLLFSRKQVVQPELLGLNDVVIEAESLLRRVIGADIALVTLADAQHDTVRADRGQLEQVVVNLAVNARDAMPSGGTLTIETGDLVVAEGTGGDHGLFAGDALPPGAYVVLTVTDTGHGMDAATQGHMFEPFFTTKAPGKGTGLGLATVYGIISQLGGAIAVRSAPGDGATFTIYLPFEAGAGAAPIERAARSALPGRLPRGDELVLVVEDEAPVRLALRRLLERQGYRVLEAQHAGDAERVYAAHADEIALVLTDVVMPGISGDALVEVLRARNPAVKVVVMSGYPGGMASLAGNAPLRSLVDGFLQKPVSSEVLLRTVRATIDGAR